MITKTTELKEIMLLLPETVQQVVLWNFATLNYLCNHCSWQSVHLFAESYDKCQLVFQVLLQIAINEMLSTNAHKINQWSQYICYILIRKLTITKWFIVKIKNFTLCSLLIDIVTRKPSNSKFVNISLNDMRYFFKLKNTLFKKAPLQYIYVIHCKLKILLHDARKKHWNYTYIKIMKLYSEANRIFDVCKCR